MAQFIFYTTVTIAILTVALFLLGIHLNKAEEAKKTQRYANFLYRWNQLCQEESEKEAESAESEDLINEHSTEGSF